MKTSGNSRIFRRSFFAAVAALSVLGVGVERSTAETGQAGAMQDAINVYQQLLNDPDTDPATRAQLREMIRQLRLEAADMQSATSGYNSGANAAAANAYPTPRGVPQHPNRGADQPPACQYASGCVMRAD